MEEKPRMFQNPFSFEGRIRRLEYGLSYIISVVAFYTVLFGSFFWGGSSITSFIVLLFFIPIGWFIFAQGAKRCHDRGNSGWFQLIPYYSLWMLFGSSDYGENAYGSNPKGEGNTTVEDMIDSLGVDDQKY